MKNLNDREEKKIDRRYANLTLGGHMSTFTIAKESNLAGQTLRDIRIRNFGCEYCLYQTR
jgi:CPA2 family monovalent cation:H+ antiporter-2